MADPVDALILDLLEWLAPQPRPYSEVISAWRTSCPGLPVWEDANDRRFVARQSHEAGGTLIRLTPLGREFLLQHRAGSPSRPRRQRAHASGIGRVAGALPVSVRAAEQRDADAWHRQRRALWPGSDDDHADEIERYFAGSVPSLDMALVAYVGAAMAGFAELSIRAYAEGCDTHGVGFLEGWYVAPDYREHGVGRALIAAAEEWARSKGCQEFASDSEPDNEPGRRAHLACGFEEVGLVRCFRKSL